MRLRKGWETVLLSSCGNSSLLGLRGGWGWRCRRVLGLGLREPEFWMVLPAQRVLQAGVWAERLGAA